MYFIYISQISICSLCLLSFKTVSKIINQYNQKAWRIISNEKIVDAKKGDWIKDEYYSDSIRKVIGKAIADCVTNSEEFVNKSSHDIIVFTVTPDDFTYENAHWNAVILYNHLNVLKGDFISKNARTTKVVLQNVHDKVFKYYNENYNIDGLGIALQKAISDIAEYTKELGIGKYMQQDIEILTKLYRLSTDDWETKPNDKHLTCSIKADSIEGQMIAPQMHLSGYYRSPKRPETFRSIYTTSTKLRFTIDEMDIKIPSVETLYSWAFDKRMIKGHKARTKNPIFELEIGGEMIEFDELAPTLQKKIQKQVDELMMTE